MERTDVIKMIGTLMQDNNIKPSELSDVVSKQDYKCVIGICKTMYEKFIQEMGEVDAYDWINEHIDAYFQNEIGIEAPRKYKSVTVEMTMELIVPKIWEKADIEDYVFTLPLANEGNTVEVTESDAELSQDDINKVNYDYSTVFNDPTQFTKEDFVAGYGYSK